MVGKLTILKKTQVVMREKGFTLIELVIVIVLLGILAATALPKFSDLTGQARTASNRGTGGALVSAVNIAHATYFSANQPSTITLEGTVFVMNTVSATPGWPVGTSPLTGTVAAPAAQDCVNLWNGILSNPTPAQLAASCTTASTAPCYAVAAPVGALCTFTFMGGAVGGTTYSVTYNSGTGAVVITP